MQTHHLTSNLSLSSLPRTSLLRRDMDAHLKYPILPMPPARKQRDGAAQGFMLGISLEGVECGLCTQINAFLPTHAGSRAQ